MEDPYVYWENSRNFDWAIEFQFAKCFFESLAEGAYLCLSEIVRHMSMLGKGIVVLFQKNGLPVLSPVDASLVGGNSFYFSIYWEFDHPN